MNEFRDITPVRETEHDMILRALEGAGQDRRLAAKLLGLNLKTLYIKLAKYGIQAMAVDTGEEEL